MTGWHLRHLAGFGLVRGASPGAAAACGFRFAVSGPSSAV
jgi:hypothetical protein